MVIKGAKGPNIDPSEPQSLANHLQTAAKWRKRDTKLPCSCYASLNLWIFLRSERSLTYLSPEPHCHIIHPWSSLQISFNQGFLNVKQLDEGTVNQPVIPSVAQLCSASQASLVFKGNRLHRGGQLRSQKINIHCVSVTLCEYLSQYEASREQEPRNQYLLALPSEELDFTIRSARSPDSTSNIISRLDMSCSDVAG